jgi:hypothetical protein
VWPSQDRLRESGENKRGNRELEEASTEMVKRRQNDSDLSGGLVEWRTPNDVKKEFMCIRCGRRKRGSRGAVWTTEAHGTKEVCFTCFEELQRRRSVAAQRQGKKAARVEGRERVAAKRDEEEGLVLCPVLLDAEERAQEARQAQASQGDASASRPDGPLLPPSSLCELISDHVDADTAAHYYRRWTECVDAQGGFSRTAGMFQFLSVAEDDACEASLQAVRDLAAAAAAKADCWGVTRGRDISRALSVAEALLERRSASQTWMAGWTKLTSAVVDSMLRETLLEELSRVRSILVFRNCEFLDGAVDAITRLLPAVLRLGKPGQEGDAQEDVTLVRFKFWQFVQACMRTWKSKEVAGLTDAHRDQLKQFLEGASKTAASAEGAHVFTAGQLTGVQTFLSEAAGK